MMRGWGYIGAKSGDFAQGGNRLRHCVIWVQERKGGRGWERRNLVSGQDATTKHLVCWETRNMLTLVCC